MVNGDTSAMPTSLRLRGAMRSIESSECGTERHRQCWKFRALGSSPLSHRVRCLVDFSDLAEDGLSLGSLVSGRSEQLVT
jgi:hypothetical protein